MEVQKYKHVCKFCKKSFPCGRSLGGHIRSHLPKPGYELRENPKKTWRAVDHDDLLINNSSFSSSNETENPKIGKMNRCQGKRSTFARSNSYSSVSEEVEAEQQEEIVVAMCLIMLSQDVFDYPSENFLLSQGKNSKSLKKRREKVVGKNSAFDATNGKKYETARNGYVQKELKSKVSVVSASGFGSNDENSKNLESKRKREKHHGNITKIESSTCGFVKNGAKTQEFEVLRNGFVSNDQNKHPPESKRKIGQIKASGYVKKGSKIEGFEASKDELVSYNEDHNMLDTELYSDVSKESCYKRNKFECTTCNKVFHSYQALGGHRASHKKLVGGPRCSPPLSTLEENGIPRTGAPPSPNDRKHSQSKQEIKEQEDVQVMRIGLSSSSSSLTPSKKLVQKHECPICFRVFPSGQALGGHKRSHLLVGSNADSTGRISEVKISNSLQQQPSTVPPKTSNNQSSKFSEVVGKLETRDLLDLNFPPAPAQDETTTSVTTTTSSKSTSLVGFMKPYWCAESSHKHEPLLDLISN